MKKKYRQHPLGLTAAVLGILVLSLMIIIAIFKLTAYFDYIPILLIIGGTLFSLGLYYAATCAVEIVEEG